ncbi:MAG: DNA helicase UvrD [Candidatus Cloacimonadota bacterium]|nr:MAG: DNA helicase UvrD [Candidatus Cloacimonadota bacterium]
MKFFADLHIHSKYSRATSSQMDLEGISEMAKLKGIKLMGTGDFTHPIWFATLKENISTIGNGLFMFNNIYFILTCEVSNIYVKNGKLRKIHNIIITPSLDSAEKVADFLSRYGKTESDGRPIISLDSDRMFERIMEIDERNYLIAAHVWTPWFSLFGSKSGFDSIEECFGEHSQKILALETGLSSDPEMNWMWSKIDNFTLVSNSDAHSPANIGREANCFDCEMDYDTITHVIKEGNTDKFLFTIEFFPEEGKYHFDGHRKCDISMHPNEAKSKENICPRCGRPLTIGVLHRVMELSDRDFGYKPEGKIPFKKVVPLMEIIALAVEHGKGTKTVERKYRELISRLGTEFEILLDVEYEDIKKVTDRSIADGILKVRKGEVEVKAGYDGVFGDVSILGSKEEKEQLELF